MKYAGLRARVSEPRTRPGQATEEHALVLVAQRKPGARTCPREAQRPAGKQTGDGQGMGTERSLPAFLDLNLAPLGFRIPGLLVPARYAQPPGTDQEGRAYAT